MTGLYCSHRDGAANNIAVSVSVKNTGTCEGAEVVQLYMRDIVGSITRPVKELKGFKRVALKPGKSKRVEFTIGHDELAFYDINNSRINTLRSS